MPTHLSFYLFSKNCKRNYKSNNNKITNKPNLVLEFNLTYLKFFSNNLCSNYKCSSYSQLHSYTYNKLIPWNITRTGVCSVAGFSDPCHELFFEEDHPWRPWSPWGLLTQHSSYIHKISSDIDEQFSMNTMK